MSNSWLKEWVDFRNFFSLWVKLQRNIKWASATSQFDILQTSLQLLRSLSVHDSAYQSILLIIRLHSLSQVSMSETATFSSASTSCRIWNMNLVQDDKQIQIVPEAIFFILFGAYMNMLSSKVKILFLIKWSDRSPQLLTNETRIVNKFWACSPISIEHISVWCPF